MGWYHCSLLLMHSLNLSCGCLKTETQWIQSEIRESLTTADARAYPVLAELLQEDGECGVLSVTPSLVSSHSHLVSLLHSEAAILAGLLVADAWDALPVESSNCFLTNADGVSREYIRLVRTAPPGTLVVALVSDGTAVSAVTSQLQAAVVDLDMETRRALVVACNASCCYRADCCGSQGAGPLAVSVAPYAPAFLRCHLASGGAAWGCGLDAALLSRALAPLEAPLQFSVPAAGPGYGTGARLGPGPRDFSGAAGEVAQRRAHVSASAVHPDTAWRDALDFTYPHRREDLSLLVGCAPPWPPALLVARALPPLAWLALLLAAAVAGLSLRASGLRWAAALPDAACLALLGRPLRADRPASSPVRRQVAAGFALSSTVVASCFTGSLLSLLASQPRQAELDTLAAVTDACRVVYVYSPVGQMLAGLPLPAGDLVRRLPLRLLADDAAMQAALLEVATAQPAAAAFLMHESACRIYSSHRLLSSAGCARCAGQRALSPAYVSFAVRRGWRGLRALDRSLLRLRAAGVPALSAGLTWHRLRLSTMTPGGGAGDTAQTSTPLTLRHCAPAGALLALGLAAASVTLLCEVLRARLVHK